MMRYTVWLLFILIMSCKEIPESVNRSITGVMSEVIFEDSTSIRAIEVTKEDLVFAGSNGVYGYYKLNTTQNGASPQVAIKNSGVVDFLGKNPAFRSIASTSNSICMLSIAQPALLYRYDKISHKTDLVYIEDVEGVFYDSLTFWNDQEGIAIGDPLDGCLSIIITRDSGASWNKLSCSDLPATMDGEAAFAASDTNISVIGEKTWIITGGKRSRVFFSPDKGNTWQVYNTPLLQGEETTGGYSLDFYDDKKGVIYGGDYLHTESNTSNIALTNDSGKSWNLIAKGMNQGYKSCVQFVPNSGGRELVAMGFTGISYSSDYGDSWEELSQEPYLSFRFFNDSIAFASGRNKVVKLTFKKD